MMGIESLILIGALLLVVGIASSRVSSRVGLPVLVLFLAVGMLAGEDGPGGLEFDNVVVANAIGTLALAAILFDGGLRTRTEAIRAAWQPSLLLATVGVVVTAGITGLAAALILDVPWLVGLLCGAIVASTDAAAVFSVLRSQGVQLPSRLAATLEVESGSNDPMAIFLTVSLIGLITGSLTPGAGVALLFVQQMGVGVAAGLGVGAASVWLVNRIGLTAMGLYPVLAGACGLLAFGVAAVLGGSGFLAIYLAGIVLGNSRLVFQRGTFLFMDGVAWVGQIAMFVVLGLLSTPSEFVTIAAPALLLAAVLIFVARPLAVLTLLPFGYRARELLLIAWVGLKGAVPIILGTFPLLAGLPQGRLLFNVVFFVVMVSAVLQGWTLPPLAARLGLRHDGPPAPRVSLELLALHDIDAEVVDHAVEAGSPLVGRGVSEVRLPAGALLALIARGRELVAPRGATVIATGDHLFVIAPRPIRDAVDRALRG